MKVTEDLLVCTYKKYTKVIRFFSSERRQVSDDKFVVEIKLSIFPSESQVISCIVAVRKGSSFNLCIGIIGKIWSIAHASGRD